MYKNLKLVLFFTFAITPLFSQKKTTAFATIEFLYPAERSSLSGNSHLKLSFGMGIGLNLKTKFTENTALVYGLEYASTQRNFIFDGFSTFGAFSHFKVPVYYQYSLALDRKNKINFFLGTKVVLQDGARISVGGSGNFGKKYEVERKEGVFPLVTFGLGYDLKFKGNYFIGLEAGYSSGFLTATETKFKSEGQEVKYSSKLSHINVKVLFPLNVK
ncbi:MAG TPA: hypothetical protein VFD77_00590 [Brumimicrobium sp.]|nr:hypothetical protein [Brumimicrobium sp.]